MVSDSCKTLAWQDGRKLTALVPSWQRVLGAAVVRGAACELAVRKAQEALCELLRTLERYGE